MRVKICGISRAEDAECAAAHGADAIGVVLWPGSPRAVDIATARRLRSCVPPFVAVVALLVDPREDEVRRVLGEVSPDLLQFHGEESEAFCGGFGVPYLKAVKLRDPAYAAAKLEGYASAKALLLDTDDPQRPGGTGRTFDWSMIPRERSRPLVLAGGLDAANVGRAIAEVRPFAVDVSSGVESAPGRKDPAKVAAFLRAVAIANQALAGQ